MLFFSYNVFWMRVSLIFFNTNTFDARKNESEIWELNRDRNVLSLSLNNDYRWRTSKIAVALFSSSSFWSWAAALVLPIFIDLSINQWFRAFNIVVVVVVNIKSMNFLFCSCTIYISNFFLYSYFCSSQNFGTSTLKL